MMFYQELLSATHSEREQFLRTPFLIDGVAGRLRLDSYVAFLTQAYYHVRQTVPLFMACGGRLPSRLDWMRGAVAEYIDEEQGHDEWILSDIRACGENQEAVRHGRPNIATEVLIAYAYDTVYRRNPIGLFGMVLVLEGTSVNLATRAANALAVSLELPPQAFSYLLSHGSLDEEHIEFYRNLMNRVTEPHDQESIVHCARVVYRLYGDMFRSLPHQPVAAAA